MVVKGAGASGHGHKSAGTVSDAYPHYEDELAMPKVEKSNWGEPPQTNECVENAV